ncbi:MAG: ABC transporter ATP-binding protein [Firmicutes bacterium]|nr:ABC transporter ATP-binding protein [Bacillota bacterium]
MIKIQRLTKVYAKGKTALHDVTLTIAPGVHGLLGPNGAGKTTLMRILATLLPPTSGSVEVFGYDLVLDKQAIRALLGYLPQEFGFYPQLTAAECLDYLAILSNIQSAKERARRIQLVLERVNLWDVQGEKVGTFSGGMKQRLGIAQLLLHDPRIIIVDEPTSGLDPHERVSFRRLIRELFESQRDRIVIISTHIVEDLTHLTPAIAVINKGKVLFSGTPEQLKEHTGRITASIEDGYLALLEER